MKYTDSFRMRGILTVRVRSARTGKLLREHTIKNMIVNRGFSAMILLLGQTNEDGAPLDPTVTSAASLAITRLSVGTGFTPPTVSPVTPTRDQTGLQGDYTFDLSPIVETHITEEPYEVVIRATLESTMANGHTLAEAGLFTAGMSTPTDNVETQTRMVSRQIHPLIPKSAGLIIEYEWHLGVSA